MGKVQFNAVFSKVWSKAVTSSNAVAGFRKAGIHPFNDKAIAIPVNDEAVSHHIAESCGQEPSKEMIDLPSTQTIDDRDMRGSIEVTSYGETVTIENSFTHQQKYSFINIELKKAMMSLLTNGMYSG